LIRIAINTQSCPYEALIEDGLLSSAAACLAELLPDCRKCFIITSPVVRRYHGRALLASFVKTRIEHHLLEMQDGERAKTLKSVGSLAVKLCKLNADRASVLVALGGGVVGDVTGFLASIYMRGTRFVQIPTTFLAQVDSSVGGKTGVNLSEGKNLIGTFHQPVMVLIDPATLKTLPARQYIAGLFEALKAGIIRNRRIFEFMEENRERILQREPSALEWLTAEAVRVKAAVVSEDEREQGLRRILNFGHTLGHALEAETRYRRFLHGEAVAWGMVGAAMISAGMKVCSTETAQRIINAVLAYAPLPVVEVRARAILHRLMHDKKTVHDKVHFVLPVDIGKVEIVNNVPEKAVLQAVEELRYLSRT